MIKTSIINDAKLSINLIHTKFLGTNDVNSKSIFLVCDEIDNPVGLVSQKEIKKIQKKNHSETTIGDIMYKKFHTITSKEQIFAIIQKMNSHPLDAIPVVDGADSKKVLGIVTADNIMNLLVKKEENQK